MAAAVERKEGDEEEERVRGGGARVDLPRDLVRTLVASLEATLQMTATPQNSSDGDGARARGSSVTVQIRGESLPRSLAMNESAMSPLLFASGPAQQWAPDLGVPTEYLIQHGYGLMSEA